MTTRPAAVAGRFYPADAGELRALVESLMDKVAVPEDDTLARGYVVPHAGYRFSGPTAAHVYARLRRHADSIRHIILVGPSHFVPADGPVASPDSAWLTPLGEVATSDAGLPTDTEVHRREHSLEVQFPFLRVCLPDVTVTPIAVGKSTIARTAELLSQLAAEGTVVLCSTDLSHYHDEETAQRLDRATADAILTGDSRRIKVTDACGVFALRGTVAWAAHHGLTARELHLATSADTVGTPDRVVGYPAFSFG